MAFESLSQKLTAALSRLTGRGKLTEQAVKEGVREVRVALLEADVNYLVVKDFCKRITDRCVGQQVLDSLTPGQQVVKIVCRGNDGAHGHAKRAPHVELQRAHHLHVVRPARRGQNHHGRKTGQLPAKNGQKAIARRL